MILEIEPSLVYKAHTLPSDPCPQTLTRDSGLLNGFGTVSIMGTLELELNVFYFYEMAVRHIMI
jgi:hypothetical protein